MKGQSSGNGPSTGPDQLIRETQSHWWWFV
jgi:hypothetical protein